MPSPIDQIYSEIFGHLPETDGLAYERLAAIALYLLNGGSVVHDSKLRGQFSKTLYQIDVRHTAEKGGATMAEVKDYSDRNAKVGRGDIQKLAGALPDLGEIEAGAFFSATGYSRPAKKYADAAELLTGGKPIRLYELTTSTEKDERGFIKTIVLRIHVSMPHPERGKMLPIVTDEGSEILKQHFLPSGQERLEIGLKLSELCDRQGQAILSIHELTSLGYGEPHSGDDTAHGSYWLPGHYVNVKGVLIPIRGIEYSVPFSYLEEELRITDDSKHRLVIRDEAGTPLRILTDKKIRQFSFDESGTLIPPNAGKTDEPEGA